MRTYMERRPQTLDTLEHASMCLQPYLHSTCGMQIRLRVCTHVLVVSLVLESALATSLPPPPAGPRPGGGGRGSSACHFATQNMKNDIELIELKELEQKAKKACMCIHAYLFIPIA